MQSLGFLVVTQPSQGRQHVGERRFGFLGVPGPEGKLEGLMTTLVKPHDHDTVEEQGHRCRPLHGLGQTIGRVLQSQELLAVFKGALRLPTIMPPKSGTYIGPPRAATHLPAAGPKMLESHSLFRALGLVNCANICSYASKE